jgi:hypothetical protein
MGKAVRASVLVLVLACSAQAGWIQNGVTDPPPPPPPQTLVAQEPPADNETPNDGPESLTETVLSVLESVLALL